MRSISRSFEIENCWNWSIERCLCLVVIRKMENFLISVFGIPEITIKILLYLWKLIVGWSQDSLSPWIKENLSPEFKKLTTEALVIIDKVNSPASLLVKKAWKELRKFLAKSIISFEKQVLPTGKVQWVRCWLTQIYNIVNPKEPKIIQYEKEEPISYEELPSDVREAIIRGNPSTLSIDFLDARDKEMEMVA